MSTSVSPLRGQRGITLIEIALFSVISAALAAVLLKGEQLIDAARVKALIAQQSQMKTAYVAFQDRYLALPGDYASATLTIPGVTASGNGNDRIEPNATPVSGSTPFETPLIWEHLARSGMLSGDFVFDPGNPTRSIPANLFGGYADIRYSNQYGNPSTPGIDRHILTTGNYVPALSLMEIDRKLDDGNGLGGQFQFSAHRWGGAQPAAPGAPGGCTDTSGVWQGAIVGAPVNCGGAWLL